MTKKPATDRAGASGRPLGSMKGRMVVRHDFDAPLPPNVLDAFEGAAESEVPPAPEAGNNSEPASQSGP